MASARGVQVKRFKRACLLAVALFCATLVAAPDPAEASHRGRIAIGSCDGARRIASSPGEVVEVAACFTQDGRPLSQHRILFVQQGPSPTQRQAAVTDAEGVAKLVLSSSRTGYSRVGACDTDTCLPPVLITWSIAGAAPPDEPVRPPDIPADVDVAVPSVVSSELTVQPEGEGFDCAKGPGSLVTAAPAFADIREVTKDPLRHPRLGRDTEAIKIVTGQNLVAGSVIYESPASVFLAFHEIGPPVDEASAFPFRGFNRVFVFWSNGNIRWGKTQLAFDGSSWRQTTPAFTVSVSHNDITFFADGGRFPSGDVAAGANVGGLCDSVGFAPVPASERAAGGAIRERDPRAIALGIVMLVLLAGLALAVMRSSEPPSSGVVVDTPSAPQIRVERAGVNYDEFGRIIGYTDIVELADGSTSTIKARVAQEALMIDKPEVLDASDWDDDLVTVQRSDIVTGPDGKVTSFVEETISPDGAVQRVRVRNITYDSRSRVTRYERTSTLMGAGADPAAERHETVTFEHDPDDQASASGPVHLATFERVERRDLRYDREGHITSFIALISADSRLEGVSSAATDAAVPRAMHDIGRAWPKVPVFMSIPNRGVRRVRHVFTRWFRLHACRVDLTITSVEDRPLSGAAFRMGAHAGHLDEHGRQRIWALRPGVYAIVVEPQPRTHEYFTPERLLDLQLGDAELAAWAVVNDVPGKLDVSVKVKVKLPTEVTPRT